MLLLNAAPAASETISFKHFEGEKSAFRQAGERPAAARRRIGSLLRTTALVPFIRPMRWFALSLIGAAAMFATQAMAIDVANQTDWNTAVAAVAAAGAGTTVTINVTAGFTLSSSLATLQAGNANVTVAITGNGQTIDGASAFQGIQVSGTNAPTVTISNLAVADTAALGGNGGNGQNGYYSSGLSYGSGGGGGGGLGAGGGLLVGSGANVTLSGVTFTNNRATGGTGGNGGVAQNVASDPVNGGNGGAGGALNNAGVTGGGGGGGTGGNTGTQGTAGTAGVALGDGGGGGGGSGTTSSTSYTTNNQGGAGNAGGGAGRPGGDGVTNNNGQGPGADGGSGGNGGSANGGAIYVATGGTLTILDTPITGAAVTGGAGGSNGVGQGPSSINGSPGATGAAVGAGIYLNTATANIGVSSGALSYANSIGGTGVTVGGVTTAINKTGAGKLTLAATNNFTGNINITAGTLAVSSSANLGTATNDVFISDGATFGVTSTATFASGRGFSIAGSSMFDIAPGTTTTLQGVVANGASVGSLVKTDTGTLVLSGTNTYSGRTDVDAGTLRAGSAGAFGNSTAFDIASAATLDLNGFPKSFGSLTGAGTVTGALSTIAGTFTPGDGTPGTSMTIAGNLAFQPTSYYVVNLNPTTASSAHVTGTATINGGTVQVLASGGSYAPATTYTILTADGGRSGTFSGVTSNLAFLDPTLSYDANTVDLTMTRNDNTVTEVATIVGSTPNQRAVAGAIDQLGDGSDVTTALLGLSADQVPGALQQLSGETYATGMQFLSDNAQLFNQTLMGRMGNGTEDGIAGGGVSVVPLSGYFEVPALTASSAAIAGVLTPAQTTTERRIAWFAPVGARGNIDGDGNAVATRWTAGGVTGGYEFTESLNGGEFFGGIAFGYLRGNASASDNNTTIQSDTGQAGVYGHWQSGQLTVSGALAGGLAQSRTDRHIVFGTTDVTASSRAWSQTLGATTEVAYALPTAHDFTLSPLATMFGLVTHRNGTTETGAGAFDLDVDGNTHSELTPGLGLELAHLTRTDNGVLKTTARAVWEHALLGRDDQSLRFAGTEAAFNVDAPDQARNRVRVGLGVEYKTNTRWSLFADYEGLFSSTERQHAGHLGAKVAF